MFVTNLVFKREFEKKNDVILLTPNSQISYTYGQKDHFENKIKLEETILKI